jgi:enoyl-CoA hydratase/carnithine racemase
MLGLLPGFGGTQRLPALIGLQNAMPMLMTGSNKKGPQVLTLLAHNLLASTRVQILTAEEVLQAKKLKLVDLTCAEKQLMQCAQVCGYIIYIYIFLIYI